MKYKVKIRRGFFWRTITAVGHRFYPKENRMDFFLECGSILSYGNWQKCDMYLGKDWVNATKKSMEKESGISVSTKI